MKYNILQEDTFGKSLKDIVLINRELIDDDVEFLLNPTNEYQEMPLRIRNMSEGMGLFISELDNESKIGIICDPDVDGYTSSALMYMFLTNECQVPKDKIQMFYHSGKQHGLSDTEIYKEIKKSDVEFLIIPDAGTNDIKELKELMRMGKRILVLDHHNMNDEEQKTIFRTEDGGLVGVIVNNQFDEYSNCLSGVGVVYKFVVSLTEDEMEHYLDLVAVGSIADSMVINDFELRYIVDKGLKNINNEFFKELFTTENEVTPNDISFNIANKMNAVCRYGKMEEKINMFRALIGEVEDTEYKPRKSKTNPNPQVEIHSLQKTMARICGNVKTRQDKAVKDSMLKIQNYIKENNCEEHKVIVVINEEKGKGSLVENNIGGLVANKLMDKFRRPIMILHKGEEEYMGSMRGYGVDSFKEILEGTEIVRCVGHDNASGVFVNKSDMPRLIKRLDRAMEDIEIQESGYTVDCEINLKTLKQRDFDEIYEMRSIWNSASGCNEPMFIIRGIEINEKDINIPFSTLLSFKVGGYKFDKNFASGEFKDRVLHTHVKTFGRKDFKFDVIVRLSKNEYNKNGYFEVVDIDSEIIEGKQSKPTKNCPF